MEWWGWAIAIIAALVILFIVQGKKVRRAKFALMQKCIEADAAVLAKKELVLAGLADGTMNTAEATRHLSEMAQITTVMKKESAERFMEMHSDVALLLMSMYSNTREVATTLDLDK